ncbi:MAG TPA: HAD family phosphatase [Blastocatellia bacterium]|nr:HAD family phosphatase [Blastocatellia bacterium]
MRRTSHPSPAIVFDFGGVLIDWDPRYLYSQMFDNDADAVERFLTEVGFVEWNTEQDRGRPFAVAIKELSERFPHYGDYIRAYDERWEESVGGAIEGTVALLSALKRAGYALYGLSNWSAETFRRIRHKHPFLDLLDVIVLSGEVQMVKPDPRIYHVLLERIKRSAAECLFIDDSEANIAAAERLGFQTIRFTSPEQLERELIARGLLPRDTDTAATMPPDYTPNKNA